VDRDGPDLSAYEPRCHTYIAVPFTAPRRGDAAALPPPVPHAAPVSSSRCGEAVGSAITPPAPDRASGTAAVAPNAGAVSVDGGVTGARPALGVLALYDRHGSDEFDDADLVTLRTFARHAAVAVDNVRVHEEAQRLSLTDPLTGLWNYRYLTESIRREVERASRFGRMISVLALDLDRFKEVNDTYGHAAGDVVLAEFARRIRNLVREVDLAFRRGGEEFVVLLPETDARGAATVAERLGAAIRDTPISIDFRSGPAVVADAPPITVTVSIGIAVYPDHAFAGPQVLDAADEALYAAKAAGRDTYRMAARQPRPAAGEPAPEEPPNVEVEPATKKPSSGGPSSGTGTPGGDLTAGDFWIEELVVPAGASPPDDGLPRAGARPGGASSGPHPPRQSRGR
jgi:diguanylate cyclase (GGDEF)-like protein